MALTYVPIPLSRLREFGREFTLETGEYVDEHMIPFAVPASLQRNRLTMFALWLTRKFNHPIDRPDPPYENNLDGWTIRCEPEDEVTVKLTWL